MQARKWCFTSWTTGAAPALANYPLDSGAPNLRYLVFQEESCPNTGRNHLQGYAEFNRPVRLQALKRWVEDPTAHCEVARGSAEENKTYCTKPESRANGPWESGEPGQGQGSRTDIQGLQEALQEGADNRSLWENHFATMVRYHRSVAAYRMATAPRTREPPVVRCYHGPTGTGKTRRVYEEAGDDLYVVDVAEKGRQAWFDGYTGQSHVLFDDYAGEYSIHFLKRLLDRYPMQLQVKTAYTMWRPTHIYITSNNEPLHWYPDAPQVDVDAILRRIHHTEYMGMRAPTPDSDNESIIL